MKKNRLFSRLSLQKLFGMSLVAAFITLGSFQASAAQQVPPPRPQTQAPAPSSKKVVPPPSRPEERAKKYKYYQGRKGFCFNNQNKPAPGPGQHLNPPGMKR